MWWQGILRCPVCGETLAKEGKSFYCAGARRHCFDLAKQGYVNLASSKAAGGGDDAALIAARTRFLSAGYYAPLAERVCALLREHALGKSVVDAGCGEGYYSCRMAAEGFSVLGVDLSKNGIKQAAKSGSANGLDALFAVAGIFELPVASESVDAVVSLFAPVGEAEFLRVLKPGGILLLVGAGPDHLLSLKRAIYDVPYQNKERADVPQNMVRVAEERLDFSMDLDSEALDALFAMTPYFYRTPKEGHERLAALKALTVGAQMDLSVWRK